jgi:L-ribulose-5-phosphate 3-epimerase
MRHLNLVLKLKEAFLEPYFLGVMQGRLLPKYKGRYQAHPVGYWQEEFKIAQSRSLDSIEFILDFEESEKNPLIYPEGMGEIVKAVKQTGVTVRSICADYFMESPLHAQNGQKSIAILNALIERCTALNVESIVIPCVDQSSIRKNGARNQFIEMMTSPMRTATQHGVFLSLETDLNPQDFNSLIRDLNSDCIRVNYDIGNSASLGFDPVEELDSYGHLISDVHIKDRVLGGKSITLGRGNAKFDVVLKKLSELKYTGPFIMQAYRDDEGLNVFDSQLEFTRGLLKKWFGNGRSK